MEEQIKDYVEAKLEELKNGAKEVRLKGVSPSILEDVISDFDWSEADTNGWQVDYWLKTSEYEISGCMYEGTANISLK